MCTHYDTVDLPLVSLADTFCTGSIGTESFVISYQYDSAKYDICCFTSWVV